MRLFPKNIVVIPTIKVAEKTSQKGLFFPIALAASARLPQALPSPLQAWPCLLHALPRLLQALPSLLQALPSTLQAVPSPLQALYSAILLYTLHGGAS